MSALPLIDFSGFRDGDAQLRAAIADEIGAACRDNGFFALTHHGISNTVIADGFSMARHFFDLPITEKRHIAIDRSPCHRGWFAQGQEVLDKSGQPQGDFKEGLKIGRHLTPDQPRVKAGMPLHGPNQYPQESGALLGFRKKMQALYDAGEGLSRDLMQAFALSLGLQATHFDRWLSAPMATLAPLRYPPMREADELSAGAHTDFGCLTLLFQHDAPGLEIKTGAEDWLAVPVLDDAIIVNIGDMMARWTGGLYASTVHRVINRAEIDRHSIAYFFDPDPEADLHPLVGAPTSSSDKADGSVTALAHLLEKIGDSFDYMDDKKNAP